MSGKNVRFGGISLVLQQIQIVKIEAKKIGQFSGNEGGIYALSGGEETFTVYSCGSGKLIRKWNIRDTTAEDFALRFPMSLYSVYFEQHNNYLVCGTSDGNLVFLNLADKSLHKEIKLSQAALFDIQHSKHNNLYCVACGDGLLVFIDSVQLEVKLSVKLCTEKIRSLDINGEQTELAVACGDGSFRIFDLKTMQQKMKMEAHRFSANSIKFHANGTHLISGGKDAFLKIWKRSADLKYELVTEIPAHNYAIYSIAFHPNKKIFATASRDKTIKIWDAETFDFLLRISKENEDAHVNSVNKILWTNYNNYLVSAGDDRAIMVWEISEVEK